MTSQLLNIGREKTQMFPNIRWCTKRVWIQKISVLLETQSRLCIELNVAWRVQLCLVDQFYSIVGTQGPNDKNSSRFNETR